MPREFAEIPLFWQDAVMDPKVQDIITRRRHRYVVNAKVLEAEGFRSVTQVTMRSGRLLRRGDAHLQYMVEGAIRYEEENRIRRAFPGKELQFRCTRGTVVPLVDPVKIQSGKGFLGSYEGFTIFVRERMQEEVEVFAGSLSVPTTRSSHTPVHFNYAPLVGATV